MGSSGPTLVNAAATEFVGSIDLRSSEGKCFDTICKILYCVVLFCQEKLFRDSEFYFSFMLAYILLFLFVTIGIFNLIMVPDLRLVQILYQSVRQLFCEGSLCLDLTINKQFGSNENRDQSESTPKIGARNKYQTISQQKAKTKRRSR